MLKDMSDDDVSERFLMAIKALTYEMLLRAMIILVAAYSVCIVAFDPQSRTHRWICGSGWEAYAVYTFTVGITLTMIADWVVNDLTPERFRFRWARRNRPYVYLIAAGVFVIWGHAAIGRDVPQALILLYVGAGLISAVSGLKMAAQIRESREAKHVFPHS